MDQLTPAQMTDQANAILIELIGNIMVADEKMDVLRAAGYSAPTMQQMLNRCVALITK